MKDKIEKIFEEIDEAISNNIIDYPIPIHKSKFIRAYEKIKKRYMKDEK